MKPGRSRGGDWNSWRWQMGRSSGTLAGIESLLPGNPEGYEELLTIYPFAATPYYLSLAAKGDRDDPVLKQCLPDIAELNDQTFPAGDPLEEERFMPTPGLIHRYRDRCLILAASTCAVLCRHCNRKRLWQKTKPDLRANLPAIVEYLSRTKEIREVIISGGDPLTLTDEVLDWLMGSLRQIGHLEVLRIGSRVPVVMPMRVTGDLCRILRKYRPLWLNTQFNHPLEITPEARKACSRLLEAGIPVSNQTVLLKGINDDYKIMLDLVHGLQRASVRPYYLFQADQVRGTGHFHVDTEAGRRIMERLRQTTSGLCLPRYVIDRPGRSGKTSLN